MKPTDSFWKEYDVHQETAAPTNRAWVAFTGLFAVILVRICTSMDASGSNVRVNGRLILVSRTLAEEVSSGHRKRGVTPFA